MFYFKKEKKILLPILDLSMKPLRLLVTKTMARYKHIDSTFNKYISLYMNTVYSELFTPVLFQPISPQSLVGKFKTGQIPMS